MTRHPGDLVIRQLTEPAEHRAAEELFTGLWKAEHPPISADVLRALAFAGSYVAGAFLVGDGRQVLVGASAGFLGGGKHRYLHSHITGVSPSARGRRVGYALKADQREWALHRGITTINWTCDPLVRRNAFFNIALLGARPTRYLTDFYGNMADAVNAGQGSDRLLMVWQLDGSATAASARPDTDPAGRVLLDCAADGSPEVFAVDPAGPLLCRVPEDIEALRAADAALGRAWRVALRDTLGAAMAAGHRVTVATRSGWYLLEAP